MFIVDLSYPLTVNRPPSTVVAGFGVLGWSRSPGVDTRGLKTENRKPVTAALKAPRIVLVTFGIKLYIRQLHESRCDRSFGKIFRGQRTTGFR
jgi:hypothetical protein